MKRKWVKKVLSIALAACMTVTVIPSTGIDAFAVEADAEEAVKYIDFNMIEHANYINEDVTNVQLNYEGTKATITGDNWSPDYGDGTKWQIQLKELIPVTKGEKYELAFTIESAVSRDIFLKVGDVEQDSTVFLEETISLEAGKPYEFKKMTTAEVGIEKLMVLFALGLTSTDENTITISDFSLKGEKSGYVDTTPYVNFDYIEHANYINEDVTNVQLNYEGTKATITGDNWSPDYGDGTKWQIQLKELIPVTKGEKYELAFTIESAVSRDIFLKVGDVEQDSTVFLEETISLEAGKPYEFKKMTTAEVGIEKLMVLFALGLTSTDENTITISNVLLKGEKSGYVVVEKPAEGKGPEYDFSATEDNAKNDYADPGKTIDGYDLIWADEFDGNYGDANVDADTGLNLDNWACQLGDGTTDCSNPGWGNNELQCYTGDKKNVAVNEDLNGDGKPDGLLRITASYEEEGYDYADESSKKYTSARLRTTEGTNELFNTTYGYIEGRMSLPGTKGAWPAFWMLPQSTEIYGGWPVSGEIDIMETCGAFANGSNAQACGTLHWGGPEHVYKGSGYVDLSSDYTYFHTYAVDWEPGKMTWYYDGKPINTLTNWKSAFSGASDALSFDAPFDQPFYMLLNLAVDSGQFGGNVNKAAFQDDINMYVDYVRVYQRQEGYVDSVVRTASDGIQDDWADYAGQNQITDIADNIVTDVPDGNVNGVETSGDGADPSKWYLAYQADATDATAETYKDAAGKNWAKVGVNSQGGQDYSVQLIGHYNAKAGYVYKVSFDAYADGAIVGKTVNCDSKEWKGWSTYGIQSFELKDTATPYSFVFEQTEDFENCRIEFNLGAQASGNVYIGNVKVEIVDPSLISREEDRKPLADGNLIYNGTFDQGDYHIGYWSVTEGTKISVPRYTTEKLTDTDVSVVDVASKTNYEAIADGVKYYERRAQITAEAGKAATVCQTDLIMPADSYALDFDLYSEKDTTVTASIYSVKVTGEEKVLDKQILTTSAAYKAEKGVNHYSWAFDTTEKLDNAALVLSFGDGASVQLDNVALIGASLAEKVDPTPMTPETTTWASDNQDGSAAVSGANGSYTATVTSGNGTAWYAPQIISNDYSLAGGKSYTLSFKYKLDGESNNTFEYIVQENGGSWTVYVPVTEVSYDKANADADGYCTYETTFTAGTSLKNVHTVFGFGHSAAKDCSFAFKDVKLSLAGGGSENPGESGGNVMPGSYSISYVLNGGTNAAANPTRYTQGEGTISLAAPTRAGYTFLGWSVGKEGAPYVTTLSKKEAGPVVLYANWKAVAVKVAGTITVTSKDISKTYGDKAFSLGAKGQGALTYVSGNDKIVKVDAAGNVTITGAGTTTVTIKSAGDATHNAATLSVTIKVAPKKVAGLKVKSKKAKKATVSWKKNAQATGYQIQYSTSKKFKKAKTVWVTKNKSKKPSKTISKLKAGKKYYVRIRAYANKAKADRVYSAWVKKTVKVKK